MKLAIVAFVGGLGLVTAAHAGAPPLEFSGTPAWYHAGSGACHTAINGQTLGASVNVRPQAQDVCGTIRDAFLLQRVIQFSLSGGTVQCSPQICGSSTSLEIGDVVLGSAE